MIEIKLNKRQIAKLEKALGDSAKKLPREISTAVNKTSTKVRSLVSREVRTELAAKAKAVNNKIDAKKRSTARTLIATVRLRKTAQIPLKEFGARQTKKGVSYKISKKRGRKTIPGAFKVAAYGENVFKRWNDTRAVGRKLKGPSPWGVFVKNKMRKPIIKQANAELKKQIDRRIRFLSLKASGKI